MMETNRDGLNHNEYTLPDDLVNIGRRCRDCKAAKVVYEITVPAPGFPRGVYCLFCLVKRCRAARMIPTPMEYELMADVEKGIGITYPGKKLYFPVPASYLVKK